MLFARFADIILVIIPAIEQNIVALTFTRRFFMCKNTAGIAQKTKYAKFIPCAASWSYPKTVIRYIIKILPPPTPMPEIMPVITATNILTTIINF